MNSRPDLDPIPISNRRRWLLVFLPALVSLVGLIILFFFQQQVTPDWQVALERYQSAQADQGNVFEVLAVVTALLPSEFGANEPFRPAMAFTSVQTPPDEIRCVEVRPAGDDRRQILLLLRSEDGSTPEDWQIYEAMGNRERVNRAVAEIGCFFPSFEE